MQKPGLEKTLVAGSASLGSKGAWGAVVGAGLQYNLQIPLNAGFTGLQVWYPRAGKKLGLDPRSAFSRHAVIATGVFQIEKQYDERYVFVDHQLASDLMEHRGQSTTLELYLADDHEPTDKIRTIQEIMGEGFTVRTSEQQHESLMRVLLLERLFVFLALAVILLISSFNIFTALSMLAVEKRRDLAVLGAMGAKPSLIWKVFLLLGLTISSTGALLGVGLGLGLCWLQSEFKLVSMGMQSAIVQEYPVEVHVADLWLIATTVLCVSLAVSWIPARGAVKGTVRD
jgi:lipoprotein-releasing system permease protein